MAIHRLLTQSQLAELVGLVPGLRDNGAFVTAMLLRLQPSADEDYPGDPAVRRAMLTRLEPFVRGLGPAHNSLNPGRFAAGAPVSLDVALKNVPELTVRIFEIDTLGHYRGTLAEVDTDIPLDGLTPTATLTLRRGDDPLRRTVEAVPLPQLARPGIYVVDFVGNGRSSRALVRKGRLRPLVVGTGAGQRFTILDDGGRKVDGATLWLEGREYTAGADGTILVPPSTAPGRKPIVVTGAIPLADGTAATISSLDAFEHEGDSRALVAGIHVDRESLRTRRTAEVVVRPALLVNGRPASLAPLEEVRLTIRSVDLDGVPAVREVAPFPLFEDRDSVHEFLVPQRLAEVTFTLSAKVASHASGGVKEDVAASRTFTVNGIDREDKVEDLFLVRAADRYRIEVRGRGGEPRPGRTVVVTLDHREVHGTGVFPLKTDAAGVIDLGPLEGIESVAVRGAEGTERQWRLRADEATWPQAIHGRVGEVVRLPFLPRAIHGTGRPAAAPTPADAALFELRGGVYAIDRFAHLGVEEGTLVLRDLPAGDFELFLADAGARIAVRITAGAAVDGFFVGPFRQLEAPPLAPTALEEIGPVGDEFVIRVAHANPFTRVHVFADRMTPAFEPFSALSVVRGPEPWQFARGAFTSAYVSGRDLGDEITYVLRRRAERAFTGAMLDRPSVLLHPWAIADTTTARQDAAAGDDFVRAGAVPQSKAQAAAPAVALPVGPAASDADLDFLADDPPVATNLVPGADGTIRLPLASLAAHQEVTVVVVDPILTLARSVALPVQAPRIVDQRLAAGLDPAGHFIQRQRVVLVDPAAGPLVIDDVTSGRFEAYDSLARVFGLFTAVSRHPDLPTFAFLLRWPGLDAAEKKRLFSAHACHELNLFLYHKDKPFFDEVVLPGLRTKRNRTFIDYWLLGDDLTAWLEPWRYGQLNVAERALLARRIAPEKPRTARHVADLLSVLPPDTGWRRELFEAAVSAGALDTADRFGTALADEKAAVAFDSLSLGVNAMGGGGLGGPAASPPAPMAAAGPAAAGDVAGKPVMLGRALRRDEARRDALSQAERKLAEAESLERLAADKDGVERQAGEARNRFFFSAPRGAEPAGLFRLLDPTKEWAENNYHHLRIAAQDASLIGPGRFWLDVVNHDPGTPFRSVHLAEATRGFPEMMLALALLDLPFESPAHATTFDGTRMTLVPAGPLVAFREETVAVEPPAAPSSILVGQNFLRHRERQEIVDGEPRDAFVTGEFLTHVVYTARVVVTNTGSARRKVAALLQIPRGSIPVLGSRATRTVPLVLEPYAVQALEYSFVFPAPGAFAHFPVHVAEGDGLVAFVPPAPVTVVDRPARPDERSWEAVSQQGSAAQVLEWLDTHTLDGVPLERIAWRMQDAELFRAVTSRLAARHVWDRTLWSYAFFHRDPAAMRVWLEHEDAFVAVLGGRLDGGLLPVDPVARRTAEHIEYWPLVNARQFMLGNRRQIVNDRFHAQYHRFLDDLARARTLTADDRLAAVVYLLIQDRVAEAREQFGRVRPDEVATPMQYDYAAAILALRTGDLARARELARGRVGFPVDRWRQRFELLLAHLDEAEGNGDAAVLDPLDREQRQGRLAAAAAALELRIEGSEVVLDHKNLAAVTVALHEMDLEVLFSRNPFAGSFAGQFGSVRANRTIPVPLVAAGGTTRVPLPADMARRNLLVTVSGGGITRSQPAYSTGLAVRVVESYGQVLVTRSADGKPVPQAYVKVYARMDDGRVAFYKDGFTDIRGRFDYASLSTDDAVHSRRFSILVTSPDDGSAVREADPPPR